MPQLKTKLRNVQNIITVEILISFFITLAACNSNFAVSNEPLSALSSIKSIPQPPLEKPLCTAPLTLAERGKVKFHPGHYVALGLNRDNGQLLDNALNEIKAPGMEAVKGVQIRYTWADLHGPNPNDFNFSRLISDMEKVEAAGKKLSVMIMWKFTTVNGGSPIPGFMANYTVGTGIPYQYALNAEGEYANGWLANLGHPMVAQEVVRFLGKLAEVVDGRNVVSSVVFVESALGLKREAFNPPMSVEAFRQLQNDYVDGLLHVDQQASCLFKHTPVIQFTNGPLQRLEDLIVNHYANWSISMGGPDVWINDEGIERVYAFYPRVENRIPIGLIVAGGNFLYESHTAETIPYSERGPYLLSGGTYNWSPQKTVIELARKARVELSANYLFWRRESRDDPFYLAFKEEIAKIGTGSQTIFPTDSNCPTNYSGNCVTNLP